MQETGKMVKEAIDTFLNSYEVTIENVMILTKLVYKQQEQIEKQQREIQYCQRKIELLEHTNMSLSNHIYAHLQAIEAVTEYDYLKTVVERDR